MSNPNNPDPNPNPNPNPNPYPYPNPNPTQAGLRVEHHDTEHSPRLEAGVPVLGQLAVLSRAPAS